jgi:hypothetical protein
LYNETGVRQSNDAAPLAVAAGLVFCLGCGSQAEDAVIDIVFDPCDRTLVVPADDVTALERDSIAEAIAMWNEVMATQLTLEPAGSEPALGVRFEDAAPMFHGVYEDEIGVVVVNRRLTGADRSITLAHELGHAFGLQHVSSGERTSVMNAGNLDVAPTDGDAISVFALWGECPAAASP